MGTLIEAKGRRFGRYVLLGHLADGGMASVYLAQLRGNNHFAKWAALKVVHPRHANNERFHKMFLTEARIVAQIDHPNVATVFDCGEDSGTYYLAMEYLSGQTLRKVLQQAVLRDRPVPLPLAARIIADAASGLHAAHELKNELGESAGIVHRDVSPHNIFVLYSGATKVMDFGIAFSNERDDEERTEIDELKGKIAYMSPEQLQRFPLDRRSDIFSLGIVLWELVTGSRLFKRRTEGEAALAVMRGEIPAPSTVRHDCPPELDRIVSKALQREEDERYETAADFAADLEEFIISTGRAAGAQMLREYMSELFADEIEEHSTSLRKASELVRQVEQEIEHTPSTTVTIETETIEVAPVSELPPAPQRSNRWLVALLVIAALGAGAWQATQWMEASAAASALDGAVQVASPPRAEQAGGDGVGEAPLAGEAPAAGEAPLAGEAPAAGEAPLAGEAAATGEAAASGERAGAAEAAAPQAAAEEPAVDAPSARVRRPWRQAPVQRINESPVVREEAPRPAAPPPPASSSSGSSAPRPMTEFE